MCTAVCLGNFFGRTLDVEQSYLEQVTVTPRNFPLPFRKKETLTCHHAICGMAYVKDGYPLYYDAMNEHGLCMAGLHFPESCRYFPEDPKKDNIASFELILWLLGQCRSVAEARPFLGKLSIYDTPFCAELPLTPLHWLLSDKKEAVVLESDKDGLQIYENPVGVLTNEPSFPAQIKNLELQPPCLPEKRGFGLPGDGASPSRFLRAVYGRANTKHPSVSQLFHILDTVKQIRGAATVNGHDHYTAYASCCDREKGIYFYTTETNRRVTGVDMKKCDLDGTQLAAYPLVTEEDILIVNV